MQKLTDLRVNIMVGIDDIMVGIKNSTNFNKFLE